MRSLVLPLLLCAAPAAADAPCASGPKAGQRPGPYSFVLCTGEQRGKSHCFVCETADRPAVIVFARELSDPLGKLAAGLDKAILDNKKADLRAWVTLLHEDQSKIDDAVLRWAKKHAVKATPVGVFEDVEGPPSYRLHKDAEVTVLLAVKQKVVLNFALRANEFGDAKVKEILDAVPKIAR